VPTVGAEVAVDAAVAWACGLVAAVDAVEAADPASNGAQLWAAGSTPVNLTGPETGEPFTFAPLAASLRAIAAPMPRPAPVTNATLPSSVPMSDPPGPGSPLRIAQRIWQSAICGCADANNRRSAPNPASAVLRQLFALSAALLFDNANCRRVGERISGNDAVAIGYDDGARLSEAPIRVLLPSLARNLVKIVGPNLDITGLGARDTAECQGDDGSN
jgi:hypothetical protein